MLQRRSYSGTMTPRDKWIPWLEMCPLRDGLTFQRLWLRRQCLGSGSIKWICVVLLWRQLQVVPFCLLMDRWHQQGLGEVGYEFLFWVKMMYLLGQALLYEYAPLYFSMTYHSWSWASDFCTYIYFLMYIRGIFWWLSWYDMCFHTCWCISAFIFIYVSCVLCFYISLWLHICDAWKSRIWLEMWSATWFWSLGICVNVIWSKCLDNLCGCRYLQQRHESRTWNVLFNCDTTSWESRNTCRW